MLGDVSEDQNIAAINQTTETDKNHIIHNITNYEMFQSNLVSVGVLLKRKINIWKSGEVIYEHMKHN